MVEAALDTGCGCSWGWQTPEEVMWVTCSLGSDGNNFFFSPDNWAIQVLSWSFTSVCTLHMHIQKSISITNAFFLLALT